MRLRHGHNREIDGEEEAVAVNGVGDGGDGGVAEVEVEVVDEIALPVMMIGKLTVSFVDIVATDAVLINGNKEKVEEEEEEEEEEEVIDDDGWLAVVVDVDDNDDDDDDDETIEPRRGRVISCMDVIQPPAS